MRSNSFFLGCPGLWRAKYIPLIAAGLAMAAANGIILPIASANPLLNYVKRPDPAFSLTEENIHETDGARVHQLRLVSQEWRGIEWRHRVSLFVPNEPRHAGTAMVFVGGGSNGKERPFDMTRRELAIARDIAVDSGIAVAVLEQVPNQPLLDGLYEDDLIAHTFLQFIRTGEEDLPLLFPMVKSAVRAMDAVTDFLAAKSGEGPSRFLVAGASKRGWTTYLTAAVDDRVVALAPMVFDILNFQPQIELQRRSFGGGTSEQIRAYEERNLFALLESEEGATLAELVDPFTYRERLNKPKLILLGANDPYWSVDAAKLYIHQLPGENRLHYSANAGHGLDHRVAPLLRIFVKAVVEGKPLPSIDWQVSEETLRASWKEEEAKVAVWTAQSPTRDFRQSTWKAQTKAAGGRVDVALDRVPGLYTARFVEVRFPVGEDEFALTTEVAVVPPLEANR